MIENNDVAKRGLEIYGSGNNVHIGLTDIVTEGQWKYSSTGTSIQIENWQSGQPNNQEGDQHWGEMNVYKDGKWNDRSTILVTDSIICELK